MRLGRISLVLIAAALVVAAGFGFRYYWYHRYDDLIARVAPIYKLDPALVRSVIHEESHFRRNAESRAGAQGLMQVTDVVMDEWRAERAYRSLPEPLERRVTRENLSNDKALSNPEINIHVGCWYLSKQIARFSDEPEPFVVALAAYNAGASHADRWLKARPATARTRDARVDAFVAAIDFPETKSYVVDVRERYAKERER